MRKLILAAIAIALMSGPVRALDEKAQAEERAEAAASPLINGLLTGAVRARHAGQCGQRNHYLAAAAEDLNFAKQMQRQNLAGAPSENQIRAAQRALDRETARRCELTAETRQFAEDLRNADPLEGEVSGDSLIVDGNIDMQAAVVAYGYVVNLEELRNAGSPIEPDIERLRRILDSFKKLMKQLKIKRDALLSGFGTEDLEKALRQYKDVRSIYWATLMQLEKARVDKVRETKKVPQQQGNPGGQQQQQQQQQQSANPFRSMPSSTRAEEVGNINWGEIRADVPEQPPLTSNEQVWLNAHNQARRYFGVPELTWNHQLARDATAWAQEMVRLNLPTARHSPREGREYSRENLLTSLPNQRTPYQMVRVWVLERRYFVPGTYPNVSSTGDWYVVSHFTQVVWPYTTEVGCGMAVSVKVEFFVCRYSPPGNRDGTYIEPNNTRWERG